MLGALVKFCKFSWALVFCPILVLDLNQALYHDMFLLIYQALFHYLIQLVTCWKDVGHEGRDSPLRHDIPLAERKIEIEELQHLLEELHHVGKLFGLRGR